MQRTPHPHLEPARWIDAAACQSADEVFLSLPDGRAITYAGLRRESGRFCAALRACGVEPGDRVAAQIEKSADAVLLYAACLRLGAAFVPINTANTHHEVAYFLEDAAPRVALVRPADHAALDPVARRAGVPCLETLGAAGEGSFMERVRDALPLEPQLSADPDALAAIVYTSGTTGRSKGAMLTRANLASNAAALADAWRFGAADVLLHTLPLFHIHGLFAALNTALIARARVLLLPRFDAAEALDRMREATVYMGVPTHYTRFLQQAALTRESTAGMRLFVSGSAPLLAETHREFERRTGHAILERYGMTETLINTSNPYEGARRPGTVGPPLPGVRVRVMSTRMGPAQETSYAGAGAPAEAPAGETGALEVQGPNVFAGYWRAPEKTHSEFTEGGWFKTGDLGLIDADGYVHIVGRAKDLVISGGYNVYPKEVETELDALAGVAESAVFGVPHPDLGEGVTAAVVARPGAALAEAGIIEALRPRLARYKVPRRVLLVEELPRNAMGKVQKNLLRAEYAALYAAGGAAASGPR